MTQPVEKACAYLKDIALWHGVCRHLSSLGKTDDNRQQLRALEKRLDALMAKNNDGKLNRAEHEELRHLVRDAEEITLTNARILAGQRTQFSSSE